jgi:hypothetical protein
MNRKLTMTHIRTLARAHHPAFSGRKPVRRVEKGNELFVNNSMLREQNTRTVLMFFWVALICGVIIGSLLPAAAPAVAGACQELERQLKNEPVLNVDETGWRTNRDKRLLWAFVAARYVVYTVAPTRGSEVLIRMLGAVFQGILCSGRFSAYLKYHSGKAQFFWAHLKRGTLWVPLGVVEFTKSNAVGRFCRNALAQHARLFRLWHKFRGGLIDANCGSVQSRSKN